VHELARLVTRLTALKLPAHPRTTLNVGTITGGTTVNTLASEAAFELDLRSEGAPELAALVQQAEDLIAAAQRDDVRFEKEQTGRRPSGELPSDHPLVRLALECLQHAGVTPSLTAGSTDANLPLSRGLPALVLGVTSGGGAHTQNEYIEIPPIRHGMQQLLSFVNRVWDS
jgi:acetylornithine deacetylase/succinyl-diaminopimelate desuccinylase-like protein